jgi:hypothetical protein
MTLPPTPTTQDPATDPHKLGFQDFLDPWAVRELEGSLARARGLLARREEAERARREIEARHG